MLFLGFTDDVLEWGWSAKLVLPTISSIPLVAIYDGSTSIVCPKFLHPILWSNNRTLTQVAKLLNNIGISPYPLSKVGLIDVSYLYYVYMAVLSIFTSNCINIYAGINGLEVGQSAVISACILCHNFYEISNGSEATENHWFAVIVLLPFLTGERKGKHPTHSRTRNVTFD